VQGGEPGRQTRQPLMRKRNIRLIVAFDGTAYHGWQIQNNLPTVQGCLSEAVFKITQERATIAGSGRTDAGTHARGLVANFMTHSQIKPAQLVRALNSILPYDIRVLSARRTALSFHARKSASSKIYRYQMYLGPVMPPHLMREYFHFPYPVDFSKMQQAARRLIGEHDFFSFAKTNSCTDAVRRVFRCELKKNGRRLWLTIEGNGFLHHMVRNIAGTLLEVGRNAISLEDFRELFIKRDRRLAGFTAPAHGLILLKVKY
jgi:tRNA pseudouridine38-40 synthase